MIDVNNVLRLRHGVHIVVWLAGGRYDGLMKAAWQQAAVTSVPPPAAVGLTLNADRLTLLASTPKAKAASVIPHLSQVAAAACPPHSTAVQTMKAPVLPAGDLHMDMKLCRLADTAISRFCVRTMQQAARHLSSRVFWPGNQI